MADRKNKQVENPPAMGVVMNMPQPALTKADQYLKAYNGYAYTAISAIAQEVASIDLHLYRKKIVAGQVQTTEEIEHESLSLLHSVNPLSTFYDLVEATQIYLELVGESFWVILKDEAKKQPKEIWLLRPDWVKVIPSATTVVDSYVYSPGGSITDKVVLPRENVIHFKYFNPLNPYRGKGSIQAAAMQLDILDFALQHNRNFFFNNATPDLIFTTEQKLDEQTVKRFVNSWQATYGGRENAHKIAFLGSGFKVDKTTMTAKDMDFSEQQRVMRDDILAVFKVPKTILGLTEDVNKANAEATTSSFMQRVVTPRMIKFVNTLNEMFLPMFKDDTLFFDFTNPAPEDTTEKLSIYDSGLTKGWLTPNEVRAMENLEPVTGGDVLLPASQFPIAVTPQSKTQKEKLLERKKLLAQLKVMLGKKDHMIMVPPKRIEQIEREKLEKKLTETLIPFISELAKQKDDQLLSGAGWEQSKRIAYWREFVKRIAKEERKIKDGLREVFNQQEQEVLTGVEEIKYYVADRRKGKESSVLPTLGSMNKKLLQVINPLLKGLLIKEGIKRRSEVDKSQFDENDKAVGNFLSKDVPFLVKSINETTKTELKTSLKEGLDKKENIEKLRDRVRGVFDRARVDRAEQITKTESIRVANLAGQIAYIQTGKVNAKEWLTEPEACKFCKSMNGKVVATDRAFFKMGDQINVKGEIMKIDLLDIDQAPLHPNCLCTLIPVVK